MSLNDEQWKAVAEAGSVAFANFQVEATELAKQESEEWAVFQMMQHLYRAEADNYGQARLVMQYTGQRRRPVDKVTITSQMRSKPTSGTVTMSGVEAWVFAQSEGIVSTLESILTPILVEAGFAVFPEKTGRFSHSNQSGWEHTWTIYPTSHPKAMAQTRS